MIKLLFLFLILFTQALFSNTQNDITVTAVGDIYCPKIFLEKKSKLIERLKLSGDIVFANFEGVLSEKKNDLYLFRMPFKLLKLLKRIGINSFSLANNHVLDDGFESYRKTYQIMQDYKFNILGLEDTGTVVQVKNQKIRLIAFSFSGKNNVNEITQAIQLIQSFKEKIIIVSAHMGGEGPKGYLIPNGVETFQDEMRGDVEKFAQACIKSGASVVLGHGPHVPRKIELYQDKLIVYSLGNFIFDFQVPKNKGFPTYSIEIKMDSQGDFKRARIISYLNQNGVPVIDKTNAAFEFLKKLNKLSKSQLLYFNKNQIFKIRK